MYSWLEHVPWDLVDTSHQSSSRQPGLTAPIFDNANPLLWWIRPSGVEYLLNGLDITDGDENPVPKITRDDGAAPKREEAPCSRSQEAFQRRIYVHQGLLYKFVLVRDISQYIYFRHHATHCYHLITDCTHEFIKSGVVPLTV